MKIGIIVLLMGLMLQGCTMKTEANLAEMWGTCFKLCDAQGTRVSRVSGGYAIACDCMEKR